MQCSPEEASPGNGPDGVCVCERRYKDPLERALRIAAGLKRKNVRDVALRLRWVAVVQANKKRKLAAAGLAAESDAKVRASPSLHDLFDRQHLAQASPDLHDLLDEEHVA